MRLDPEAEKVVKSFPSDSSGKPPEVSALRAATRQMNIEAGGPAMEMASVQDASPEQIGSPVPLRIYRPKSLPEAAAPAMIFVHGGGWVIGDLDSYDAVCRQLADRAKCVVLSVDYRLAPEHPAPAASDDVIATLKWIFARATSLGIDRDRIAIGGDSAGGGLSASAAIAARDAELPLRCQILIYPATDQRNLSWEYASRQRNAEIPPLTLSMMKWFSDLYLPDKTLAEDWRISPLAAYRRSFCFSSNDWGNALEGRRAIVNRIDPTEPLSTYRPGLTRWPMSARSSFWYEQSSPQRR